MCAIGNWPMWLWGLALCCLLRLSCDIMLDHGRRQVQKGRLRAGLVTMIPCRSQTVLPWSWTHIHTPTPPLGPGVRQLKEDSRGKGSDCGHNYCFTTTKWVNKSPTTCVWHRMAIAPIVISPTLRSLPGSTPEPKTHRKGNSGKHSSAEPSWILQTHHGIT